MHLRYHSLCLLHLLLLSFSLAQTQNEVQPIEVRDIFSPIESLANSILGITTGQTTKQTPTSQTKSDLASPTGEQVFTITSTPEPSRVQTSAPTFTDSISDATTESAAATTSSTDSSTTDVSIQPLEPTTSTSSTPTFTLPTIKTTSANPIPALPSTLSSAPQAKHDSGNEVNAGGIAVGVIFSAIIFAGLAYLFYKLFPSAKEKFFMWRRSRHGGRSEKDRASKDEEHGMVKSMGLGLGEITNLKHGHRNSWSPPVSYHDMSSRPSSEDTLVSESPSPLSLLDRRNSPLPPPPRINHHTEPFVSPVEGPLPRCLTITPPPASVPYDPLQRSYTPYRPESNIQIGLAIPMRKAVGGYKNLPPIPETSEVRRIYPTYGSSRRLSGIHELS